MTTATCNKIINLNQIQEEDEELQPWLSDVKHCVDCKTTKTPLWRNGPAGPKSLCNACGIRIRKKKKKKKIKHHQLVVVVDSSIQDSKRKRMRRRRYVEGECSSNSSTRIMMMMMNKKRRRVDLRPMVMGFGKQVVLPNKHKQRCSKQRQINQEIGEVEQAALLLMAMSSSASLFV